MSKTSPTKLDKKLLELIKKEISSYLLKEKTYTNYTSCMSEINSWLAKKAQ